MKHGLGIDVLACPCGQRMKLVTAASAGLRCAIADSALGLGAGGAQVRLHGRARAV